MNIFALEKGYRLKSRDAIFFNMVKKLNLMFFDTVAF